MSAFGDIRGAIDGIHVLAHVPASQRAAYRNRKGEISQNVLAGCSLDMYFFYVCPGVTTLQTGSYSGLDSSPYGIPSGNHIEDRPVYLVYYR